MITQTGTESELIYRQAAIDMCRKPRMRNADCSDFEMEIMMLPSAQPETTRKVIASSRDGITMWYKCEKCGEAVDQSDNYCSCCGRRFSDGGPDKQTGGD